MAKDWSHDREEGAESSHKERWLVTYADLITLLLIFFIVMYALSSRVSGEKFDKLAVSLATSMKKVATPKPQEKNAFSADDTHQTRKFKATADSVIKAVVATDPKSQVKVAIDERGLIVSLIDASFFASGSAVLLPRAYPLLARMAEGFTKLPNEIRIEGHTDATPMHNARFASNWELSSARATAVVRFFIERGAIASHRLSAVGNADNKPVASNKTEQGRRANRRVDIVIVKQEERKETLGAVGLSASPVAPSPTRALRTPDPFSPENGFSNPFGQQD